MQDYSLSKTPSGYWNDGLLCENTGLFLAENGSGDYISLLCCELNWSYDLETNLVQIKLKSDSNKIAQKLLNFCYDSDHQTLTLINSQDSKKSWILYRANQNYIHWWLQVRMQNDG